MKGERNGEGGKRNILEIDSLWKPYPTHIMTQIQKPKREIQLAEGAISRPGTKVMRRKAV